MRRTRVLAACCSLAMASLSSAAMATEGGVFGGPIGGTDIRAALLPPKPGLYGAAVALVGFADELEGPDGKRSSTLNPASYRSANQAIGLVLVYPFKPLGFTLSSSFQGGIAEQRQSLTVPGIGHQKGKASGAADSYTDLLFASRWIGLLGARPGIGTRLPYGLTVGGGVALELPIGTTRVPRIPSPGKNIFITIPNAAFTYLTGPNLSIADGTEISARFFYELLNRNGITQIKSGTLIDLDWAITERAKSAQFGLAGAYAQQVASDRRGDDSKVPPNGNYYQRISLGGVAAYDFPHSGGTVRFKALFPVRATNSYNATVITLSYSRRIF